MSLGLICARTAARLPRGYRHVVKRIARLFPDLHSVPVESRFGETIYCDLRESVVQQIFKNGGYDHTLREEAWFKNNLRPDDVVFDVGGNIGYMLVQFAPIAKHVHVFEPSPRALANLRKTAAAYPNVTLHEVAVSDCSGTIFFQEEDRLDTSHVADEGTPVEAITLDSLGIVPTFIKLDIEGHEQAALRGATEILKTGPVIFYEALSEDDEREIEAILKRANPAYRVERIAPEVRNFVACAGDQYRESSFNVAPSKI